jgi:hypothetical protein
MITVEAALVPLYTVAAQYEYRLTYTYTNSDYTVDPLLKTPANQFVLDKTLNRCANTTGPAAQ